MIKFFWPTASNDQVAVFFIKNLCAIFSNNNMSKLSDQELAMAIGRGFDQMSNTSKVKVLDKQANLIMYACQIAALRRSDMTFISAVKNAELALLKGGATFTTPELIKLRDLFANQGAAIF